MTCGGENGTNFFWLFSKDIAFTHHFVAPHPPIGVLVVLAMPVTNYLKQWESQLAI